MTRPVLVLDFGTTSLRVSVVSPQGTILAMRRVVLPHLPGKPGEVAWDGNAIAGAVIGQTRALAGAYPVCGIAIASQRVTTVLWDRATGRAAGPVLSWSDTRTASFDRALRKSGSGHIPNLTGSKLRWLLDEADPDRQAADTGQLCGGTLESFIAFALSGGTLHISDHSNAVQSGLLDRRTLDWDRRTTDILGIPLSILPRPVPCLGPHGMAMAIAPDLPILGLIGDQQSALLGQYCDAPGEAKLSFGTVGVVNVVVGDTPLPASSRAAFSNLAYSDRDTVRFGAESSIQSAGSAIEWLVSVGILPEPAAIDHLVDPRRKSDRAIFVSALYGLGAPQWKPAARGAFFGLAGNDGRETLIRAVLDGIVCATAEILDLIETELGRRLGPISVDGGLSASTAFLSILSASLGRDLVSTGTVEATTMGAARLGLRAVGIEADMRGGQPRPILAHPDTLPADRDVWRRAVELVTIEQAQALEKKP